jgi:hypothetical protein
MFFADMLLYTIGRFFFRASIILFYIRIFPPKPDKTFSRLLTGTMVFNLVYNFTFLMAIIFQCQPLPYFWRQWEGLHDGHCGNYNILAWVAAATGIVFDVWMLALPLSQLMALTLPWRKKIMGGLMFFFGVGCVTPFVTPFGTPGTRRCTNNASAPTASCLSASPASRPSTSSPRRSIRRVRYTSHSNP